ncbi:MAG: DUF4185 domain-containing protein [Anaerolineae bacterium]|nr:DUF4185 domain-containing protein [Anaerolineae bacterium]
MRLRVILYLAVLALASESAALAQEGTALRAITDVEFVAWVTGPESPSQTDVRYDVDGTDLGSMFALGDTLYIAFGDTFGCCRPAGGGAGGENWRSNVLAYTTDTELEDGITFDGMITDDNGRARAVLRRWRDDVTIIPTYGIAIGDRLALHYMAVKEWGPPGEWTLNRSGWAYSDDGGQTWEQPFDAIWEGDTNFGQAALVLQEDYLYVFGIHGGRFGGVALARVPAESFLKMDAYRYWDGTTWVEGHENAIVIASAPVGELSVAWNAYLQRWIMTYLDEVRRAIVLREAPELTGPWSKPMIVVSADDYPSLYGAYLHPWASDGEVIYFNMSQWGPYNVRLMRARLVASD